MYRIQAEHRGLALPARPPLRHDAPMSDLVSLRDERERVVARLSDAFAQDAFDVDEFERRLTIAHRAMTQAELAGLVSDLPAVAATAQPATTASATSSTALVPASSVRETDRIVAIMGGTTRKGGWTPPRVLKVTSMMGGVVLDFREARLAAGITEVRVTTIMGGLHVIVPPGLSVEVSGTAIMGGFDHVDRAPAAPEPDRPALHIHGLAIMGGVHVETRLPGEGERDARRRRRQERKALRKAGQEALPPHED